MSKMRNFVSLDGVSGAEINAILDLAAKQKADPESYHRNPVLQRKAVGLFFEKASLRTRISFEVAVAQLGGTCVYMGPETGRIGEREAIVDLAKVSSRYLDAFVLRTFRDDSGVSKQTRLPVVLLVFLLLHPLRRGCHHSFRYLRFA